MNMQFREWTSAIVLALALPAVGAPASSKAQDEEDFQFAVKAARAVRATAKDPSTFQVIQAGVVPGGVACIIYSAKNSFNATVRELAAVRRDMKRGNWNKECARSGLTDVSHIRKAL
ncbi:MAG: hypothetical protein ACO1PM_08195 [Acidovorax sp.]